MQSDCLWRRLDKKELNPRLLSEACLVLGNWGIQINSLGANCLISLPAAWRRNEIVAAFIAEGWIIFCFVGIKPHRIIYVQPSKIKLKHLKRSWWTYLQTDDHWFQCRNGVVRTVCRPLGDVCFLGEKCVQNIPQPLLWVFFSTFHSNTTQKILAPAEKGQTHSTPGFTTTRQS